MRKLVQELSCFKANDIRGRLGNELNENIAARIGRAYGEYIKPETVVVGGDIRHSSEALKKALSKGLMEAGVNVIDLGMTGTEEIYFATFYLNVDGGIEVTASHNPIDYNGMKLVGKNAQPISSDSGLNAIKNLAEHAVFTPVIKKGVLLKKNIISDYIEHLLQYIDMEKIQPLKIVVNSGNGCAGHVIDALEREFNGSMIPIDFIKIHHEANGDFPHGIPNPLLPENRSTTSSAVIKHGADIGIAWDGDFDRCFFFDEKGSFIEGYYIVGLLAQAFLKKHPGSKIIHDPRLTWNTIEQVEALGGIPILSKTGHGFIKERMRIEDAVYGGEMSAHHYFRDFSYCDSGMIPWLLVIELMSEFKQPISSLVSERMNKFPSSGEINRKVKNPDAVIKQVVEYYMPIAKNIDYIDGVSLEMENWRMNIRKSNTEPLLRLNIESRENKKLVKNKTREILKFMI